MGRDDPFISKLYLQKWQPKIQLIVISFQVDQLHWSALQPQPQGFWAIMTMALTHWEEPVSPLCLLSPFLTWQSCLYIGKLTILSITSWSDELLYDLPFGWIIVEIMKGGGIQRAEDGICRVDWSLLSYTLSRFRWLDTCWNGGSSAKASVVIRCDS